VEWRVNEKASILTEKRGFFVIYWSPRQFGVLLYH
jgi:hypothetical protein